MEPYAARLADITARLQAAIDAGATRVELSEASNELAAPLEELRAARSHVPIANDELVMAVLKLRAVFRDVRYSAIP